MDSVLSSIPPRIDFNSLPYKLPGVDLLVIAALEAVNQARQETTLDLCELYVGTSNGTAVDPISGCVERWKSNYKKRGYSRLVKLISFRRENVPEWFVWYSAAKGYPADKLVESWAREYERGLVRCFRQLSRDVPGGVPIANSVGGGNGGRTHSVRDTYNVYVALKMGPYIEKPCDTMMVLHSPDSGMPLLVPCNTICVVYKKQVGRTFRCITACGVVLTVPIP